MNPFETPPERRQLTRAGSNELISAVSVGMTAGLPLDEIFQAVADDCEDRRLREVAARIAGELQRGADVSTALSAVTGSLPPYLERALAASTDLSQSAAVMAALARHESTRQKIRRQMRSALTYPVIVSVLLGVILVGLTSIVVPQFDSIYKDFDLELPVITVFLVSTARVVLWVVLSVPLAAVAIVLAARVPPLTRIIHWLRTGVPMVGPLCVYSAHHEFASILGALVGQSVALDDALLCTAESLRDRNLARSTRIAADKCAGGALLSESLAESIHFDTMLPALAAWGEAHGTMTEAMRQATLAFEREFEMRAVFLQRILPAMLFLTVIGTMFMFTLALFVPLVDMVNNLSG